MAKIRLTRTQTSIYELLQDGQFHTDKEIKLLIDPYAELVSENLLWVHISNVRKAVVAAHQGTEIVRELVRQLKGYRMVRLLNMNDE